ncbi:MULTISPECIES: type II toxin-antitoxin system HicA family toxin [unclassified Methanoculleus]|uniref:type II toxin-antitoxin system HicA family toxin n=1 Tax=unclassified Methanoculleus TaxID=2619537 RepID=UPI0025CCC5C2|nr:MULTISPECIES: type II toxin-antitoxin system HicA family toxin [unclassified Methanoculleus]
MLESIGYSFLRQTGSHVRMGKQCVTGVKPITVPLHNEINVKTLNVLLNDISNQTDIPKEKLLEMLR